MRHELPKTLDKWGLRRPSRLLFELTLLYDLMQTNGTFFVLYRGRCFGAESHTIFRITQILLFHKLLFLPFFAIQLLLGKVCRKQKKEQ